MKQSGQVLAVAALILCGVGAGFFRPHTRPKYLPGIPDVKYQHGPPPQTTDTRSTTGILVEKPAEPAPAVPKDSDQKPGLAGRAVKVFQLSAAAVQIDHCFLSRVAVTLHDDGRWTVSARADQNPKLTGDLAEIVAPFRKELGRWLSNYLKRNTFSVKVRCLGLAQVDSKLPNLAPGKPVLARLEVDPFVVQNGEPFDLRFEGTLPEVKQFFDLIDRVEIELSYR